MNARSDLWPALFIALGGAGCEQDRPIDPPAPAPATKTATPSPPSSTASPSASTIATAEASAAPTATPSTESPEPALEEWATSRIVQVPGSTANACDTRMVREWLRVQCVPRSAELGIPERIVIKRGRATGERSQGENLMRVNDITTLVIPVRPGLDFAADFYWENGQHELTVRWPTGAPSAAMAFDNPPSSPSAAALDGPAGGDVAAIAGTPPVPTEPEPPLDDIEGLGEPPADASWESLPEARVGGSTAAGCETKQQGDWFRVVCAGEGELGHVLSLKPIRGHRATQTTVELTNGRAVLLTPYVAGTEMHALFKFAGGSRALVLRWKKGSSQPTTQGAFEAL